MSDLTSVLERIERSGKVRIVQDIYGHETIEVQPRLLPVWRRLELSRKDAAAVCRIMRRAATVCPSTGRVWLPQTVSLSEAVTDPASGRRH